MSDRGEKYSKYLDESSDDDGGGYAEYFNASRSVLVDYEDGHRDNTKSTCELVWNLNCYPPPDAEQMVFLRNANIPIRFIKPNSPRTATRNMMTNGSVKPFIIGIAGGTASGKTSVCKTIMDRLGENSLSVDKRKVACIVQDNFYRRLTPAESALAAVGTYNFDHPHALDLPLMERVLDNLMHNQEAQVPVYDFTTNSPKPNEIEKIYPAEVILVEGILAFYFEEIRAHFDLKIFVEEDADIRLCRRIQRDVEERGRDIDQILNQYMATVKPAFEEFCSPTKKHADIIVPHGEENTVAINLIVQHIKEVLARGQENTHASGRAPRFQAGTSRSGLH